jgi:hypothetical protein
LLAPDEDLILHVARGQVGFNKDHCLLCAYQGRKSLPPSYFIIFSLPNIYTQIKPCVMLAWSSAMPQATLPRQRHCQQDLVGTSHHNQCRLGSAIANKTQ